MSVLLRGGRRALNLVMAPLRAYDKACKKHPFGVGVITTLIKTSLADVFAQTVVERKETLDWRRNAVFSIFGFAYLGCWQYYLYAKLFTRVTPTIVASMGQRAVGPMLTFLDQCVHHPIMYFPVFYLLRGSMAGESPSKSLNQYRQDMWENMKALWMVWVPAQLVNFSVVPLHLRIPFVAGVSFAWTVILSVLRGSLTTEDLVQEAKHVVHAVADGVHGIEGKIHEIEHKIEERYHVMQKIHNIENRLDDILHLPHHHHQQHISLAQTSHSSASEALSAIGKPSAADQEQHGQELLAIATSYALQNNPLDNINIPTKSARAAVTRDLSGPALAPVAVPDVSHALPHAAAAASPVEPQGSSTASTASLLGLKLLAADVVYADTGATSAKAA